LSFLFLGLAVEPSVGLKRDLLAGLSLLKFREAVSSKSPKPKSNLAVIFVLVNADSGLALGLTGLGGELDERSSITSVIVKDKR
jgi:hypothetical protein